MSVREKRKNIFSKSASLAVGLIALGTLWSVISLQSNLLPSFPDIISSLFKLMRDGETYKAIWATLSRSICGFALSAFFGTLFGVVIGSSSYARFAFVPIVDFMRSTPVTSLYPVFVVLLGVGDLSKIAMIFWGSVFVVTVNSIYGVANARPDRKLMAQVFGVSKTKIFFQISLFEALPSIFDGLRISLSLSLIIAILTEMFMGAKHGIGQEMIDFYTTFNMPSMFAVIVYSGVIGYFFNVIFLKFERLSIPWREI